jgi:DNA-binding protein Fis
MNHDSENNGATSRPLERDSGAGLDSGDVLSSNIGASIDRLVEYLVENDIEGVHPLIMGEIEKRVLTRTLELSRGNKVKAARILGISRNTFHRKIQKLTDSHEFDS